MNANDWIALVNLPTKVLILMRWHQRESGAMKLKNSRLIFGKGRYAAAAAELEDSNWHRQTPSRVEEYMQILNTIV